MDQRVVVGVGNIYACEGLFRARLSPRRIAGHLRPREAARLAAAVRTVLAEAIEAGGSSLRDYVQTDGQLGFYQERFAVYGLSGQPCRVCGAPIRRITQANRTTFYCGLPRSVASAAAAGVRGQFRTGRARGRSCYSRTLAASRATGRRRATPLRRHRRWKILSGAKSHGVRDHPGRDARAGRLDHPQSAESAQRAESPADRGAQSGARRVRGRSRDRGHGAHRLGTGVRSRCGRQGNGSPGFHGGVAGRLHRQLAGGRPLPQADHRGGGRIRAGRRLRACHDVRHHHRRGQCQVRPAGDQSRHHPRRRRHPAADPRTSARPRPWRWCSPDA